MAYDGRLLRLAQERYEADRTRLEAAVSYTHLTLPTTR